MTRSSIATTPGPSGAPIDAAAGVFDHARYAANLAALRLRQPDIAEAIDRSQTPFGATPAVGRDGSPTARVRTSDGRAVWFGGSSMPRISAEAQYSEAAYQGGNVSLPGILTGLEALALAERLPPHAAVFVFEPSLAALKLAMHLHDYVSILATGRLVFLRDDGRRSSTVAEISKPVDPASTAGNGLADSLERFWRRYPGYEIPSFLFNAPQFSPSEMADLRQRIELAGEAVVRMQQQCLAASMQSLGESRNLNSEQGGKRAVAVLSADARPAAITAARRIAAALVAQCRPSAACIPDHPETCHVVARLEAAASVGAEWVVVVGAGFEPLRELLPPHVTMTWHAVADDEPPGTLVGAMGPSDRLIVSRASAWDVLANHLDMRRVIRLEPAVDDAVFHPPTPDEPIAATCDVALLCDLPDHRPESCDVVLTSHISLWRALVDAVSRDAETYDESRAPFLLAEALRQSNAQLRDEPVRNLFERTLRERIAPAIIARRTAAALVESGFSVHVFGAGWGLEPVDRVIVKGLVPDGPELRRTVLGARLVAVPWSTGEGVRRCLASLACGVPAALRLASIPFERDYPDLVPLRSHLHVYRSPRDLVEIARHMKQWRQGPLLEASEAVRRSHNMVDRLTRLEQSLTFASR